ADRNRSHWSTSKTPSYTKSVSWQHHPDLHKGIAALKAAGITEFSTTELEMIAQSEVELSPEDLEIFEGLVDALEDDDDVQKVYHNVANL
ncbi:YebC/PmpR family DNA-binding transcriptional regulator, partial [Escherichia coli]